MPNDIKENDFQKIIEGTAIDIVNELKRIYMCIDENNYLKNKHTDSNNQNQQQEEKRKLIIRIYF